MLTAVAARRNSFLLFALLSSTSLWGCGAPSGPVRNYAEVTGTVKYQGKPLTMGQVIFQPGSGAAVTGDIQANGTYSLKGVIGPNAVMIVSRDPEPKRTGEKVPYVPPKDHIPAKYGTPSGAQGFEVKAGKNTADFDLK